MDAVKVYHITHESLQCKPFSSFINYLASTDRIHVVAMF